MQPGHDARVSFHAGRFAYVLRDGDRIVRANGIDGELPSLDALVIDSHAFIDWHRSIDVLRKLRKLEIGQFDVESKRILERVFV